MELAFLFTIGLALGGILGAIATMIFIKSDLYGGRLCWVEDEDGVYPYIEANASIRNLSKKGYVLFEVAQSAKNADPIME